MPFIVQCSSCGVKLRIRDRAEGKKIACPKCQLVFTAQRVVPFPEVAVVAPDDDHLATPPESRVFISHAVADQQFVDTHVLEFFKSHNIATWHCEHDIPAGANWREYIRDGLEKTDWFVVVLSPRSEESEAVRQEVDLAFEEKQGRILPILLEKCNIAALHPDLPDLQYVDFTEDPDRAKRYLLVSMVRQLNKERHEWENKSEHQSQSIEDLKSENAELKKQVRDSTEKFRRAASFDGNWSGKNDFGTIPQFQPLGIRKVPIIAFSNFKGGVGKSTLTANLGATLWSDPHRKRVLLIDLDYQGSLSGMCLDRKQLSKLAEQQRLVQELFKNPEPDPRVIIQLAREVVDQRTKNHEASLIAADDDLAVVEGELLGKWMMGDNGVDARYILREYLHSDVIAKNFDLVLLDCPPRMTAAAINAFLAADFVLIPTPLEALSIEAVPRLLSWIRERRQKLLIDLDVLGVVVTRTKQTSLLNHEKELYDRLIYNCQDAWDADLRVFETYIPTFPAITNGFRYPAQHAKLKGVFAKLLNEIMPSLSVSPAGAKAKTASTHIQA